MDQIALLPNCILLLTDGAGSKRRVRSWHGLVNSHQVDWTWNLSTGAWSNSRHWRRVEVKLNGGARACAGVIGLFLCRGRWKERATLAEVLCTSCRLPGPIRGWQTDVRRAQSCQSPVMKGTSVLEKAEEVKEEVEEQQALHPHWNHFTTNGLNATYCVPLGGTASEHCNAKEPSMQGQ